MLFMVQRKTMPRTPAAPRTSPLPSVANRLPVAGWQQQMQGFIFPHSSGITTTVDISDPRTQHAGCNKTVV